MSKTKQPLNKRDQKREHVLRIIINQQTIVFITIYSVGGLYMNHVCDGYVLVVI